MELLYTPDKVTKNTVRFSQEGWPVVSQTFYVPKPILEEAGVEIPEEGMPQASVKLTVDIVAQE